ncbi:MAG: hypothetical protein ACXW1Z_12095 [Methylobacter sp.]
MKNQPTKNTENAPPLFSLGNCSLTPGISNLIKQHALPIYDYLCRHQCGDWGEVTKENAAKNNLFLKQGLPLLSSYDFKQKNDADIVIKIWIITEVKYDYTTVSLPEEYQSYLV